MEGIKSVFIFVKDTIPNIYVRTARPISASVVQFDYQGRILWQSPVRQFFPGEHSVDTPEAGTRSIYKLNVLP